MMGVPTRKSRRFRLAALGIIFLTIAIRLPSLVHPQPIDSEAMYSVVANEIVDGGRPYVDAVERKPPLLFWTYAAVFKVAGKFNWKALQSNPRTLQYPVKNFPILTKLLKERYQPVARTAEGTIYRMR